MTPAGQLVGLTRRGALATAGAGLAFAFVKPFAWAAGKSGLHGLSIFGELKYEADFPHFDYINPDAPKGGRMNFSPPNWALNQSTQTFNTLNTFVLKGDAPPRMGMTFDSLMTRAADEPDAVYGLVAESVDVSDDGNAYFFHIRPTARFHDGTPLTAHDVAFSLELLKEKGHPSISQLLKEMMRAEAPDEATVVVTLSGNQNRETILTIVGLPILSRAYYATREFDASTLDPPLGSGPYRVGSLNAGRFIEYERVPDYWARDLPVARGHDNFDAIRIDFFAERQAAFEAFKKGEVTYRQEFTSLTWAQQYNFPAVTEGKVKKSTAFPSETRPSMQGWYFNTRREKFADPRTRQGIALAFDFEWTNRNLFFDSYARQQSFFQRSELAAYERPDEAELELLEPFRDSLPASVFDAPYIPPKTDGSGRDRTILRQAQDLLLDAGWRQRDNAVVDADGKPLTIEFLIRAAVFERVLSPFIENLRFIGVEATIRLVDPAQYTRRLDGFDYDVVGAAFGVGATPLDGLQLFFSTEAANRPGGRNLAGVREPAVDAILKQVKNVNSRPELITITRAIDRILRARHYWIPNWFLANHRVAHWDVFDWPPTKPDYAFQPERTWWFDEGRAAAIGYEG